MNEETEQTAKVEIPAEMLNVGQLSLNYITTDKFYAKVGTVVTETGERRFIEVKVDKINKIGQVFCDGVLKFEMKAVDIGASIFYKVVLRAALQWVGLQGKNRRKHLRARLERLAAAENAAEALPAPLHIAEPDHDTVIGRGALTEGASNGEA